jgi:pyruvate,water dikinase
MLGELNKMEEYANKKTPDVTNVNIPADVDAARSVLKQHLENIAKPAKPTDRKAGIPMLVFSTSLTLSFLAWPFFHYLKYEFLPFNVAIPAGIGFAATIFVTAILLWRFPLLRILFDTHDLKKIKSAQKAIGQFKRSEIKAEDFKSTVLPHITSLMAIITRKSDGVVSEAVTKAIKEKAAKALKRLNKASGKSVEKAMRSILTDASVDKEFQEEVESVMKKFSWPLSWWKTTTGQIFIAVGVVSVIVVLLNFMPYQVLIPAMLSTIVLSIFDVSIFGFLSRWKNIIRRVDKSESTIQKEARFIAYFIASADAASQKLDKGKYDEAIPEIDELAEMLYRVRDHSYLPAQDTHFLREKLLDLNDRFNDRFWKSSNVDNEFLVKSATDVSSKIAGLKINIGFEAKRMLSSAVLLIVLGAVLYVTFSGGVINHSVLAQLIFASPVVLSMVSIGSKGVEKILGNVGTKNASNESFYLNYLDVLIKKDMAGERFVKLDIREDGLQIVSMGRSASAIDEKLTKKISALSSELTEYLEKNKDLIGCQIDLTEPFVNGGRASRHPHLLAVSGMATDWLVAHSGLKGGEGKYVYMRRAFFEDADLKTLKDVLTRQLEYLREKYNAFRHDKPAPIGAVDVKEELLSRIKPLVKNELEEVRRYDVRISSGYALDQDVVANAVKQIALISGSDELKKCGPVQKMLEDIKIFQKLIESHDLFQAISIWGSINYEISMLEERPDKIGEIIKKHPNMMMFKGIASGINAVIEKYISEHGLINRNGVLPGKSVGKLVIVNDPDKVMESLVAGKGDEIWVIPYLPARSNIFEGQGIIISIDGDEHSKDTAIEKGIPFAIVPNGVELLKHLDGKQCMMRVETDGSVRVRLATTQEIKVKDIFVKIPMEKVINIPPAIIGKNLSYDLSDICESHLPFIGSKSTNDGIMLNEGLPVPDGFALTFAAWDTFESHNSIRSKIEELRNSIKIIPKQTVNAGGRTVVQAGVVTTDEKELSQTLAKIRETIVNGEMPKDVESEILKKIHNLREKYKKTYGNDFSFYVRSSFNFEDLPEEKAAGHYESYPSGEFRSTVTDEEILKAVRLVWASKWNEAAFRLRVKEDIADDKVLPGVLIQIPVKAKIAGKMSTAHVVAQNRNEIELKASRGQGSGVVDKRGAPALAIVHKYSKEVTIKKPKSDVDSEDVFLDGAMETKDTTADEFQEDIFTDSLCRFLAEKGEEIEAIFGNNPQDVEWVLDHSGAVWFVQSRPMPEFKSYEVTYTSGILHKTYIENVLGLVKENDLVLAARYRKEKNLAGLIGMLRSDKEETSENIALWHMVLSYIKILAKDPAVANKITAEQIEGITIFANEGRNIRRAYIGELCMEVLFNIDKNAPKESIKEFFVSMISEVNRGGVSHLVKLPALKIYVKYGFADAVLETANALYIKNNDKDKSFADKILIALLEFKDPRIIPLLKKFEADYTGDIKEAATRMINRIEERENLSFGSLIALAMKFGMRRYSPIEDAPRIEESIKVGVPLTIFSILNIFNHDMPILNISIFIGMLAVSGVVFILLHIFNTRAPPKTKTEIRNLFWAPSRAAIDGGLIALFTLSFLTLPTLLFPLMAVVTTKLAISRHRSINLYVRQQRAKGSDLKYAKIGSESKKLQGVSHVAVDITKVLGQEKKLPSQMKIRKSVWEILSRSPEDVTNLEFVIGANLEELRNSPKLQEKNSRGENIITIGKQDEGVVYIRLKNPILVGDRMISILKVIGALPVISKKGVIISHYRGSVENQLSVVVDKKTKEP